MKVHSVNWKQPVRTSSVEPALSIVLLAVFLWGPHFLFLLIVLTLGFYVPRTPHFGSFASGFFSLGNPGQKLMVNC